MRQENVSSGGAVDLDFDFLSQCLRCGVTTDMVYVFVVGDVRPEVCIGC